MQLDSWISGQIDWWLAGYGANLLHRWLHSFIADRQQDSWVAKQLDGLLES